MKTVKEVLKNLDAKIYELKVFTETGGFLGFIREDELDKDKAELFSQLFVRNGEGFVNVLNPSVATIPVREQDNLEHIQLMYEIIADKKFNSWKGDKKMKTVFDLETYVVYMASNGLISELVKSLEVGWPQKMNGATKEEFEQKGYLLAEQWLKEVAE